MIAIAALYLALVFHKPTRDAIHAQSSNTQSQPQPPSSSSSNPRRSSRSTSSTPKKPAQDTIGFIAGLNVNIEVVASIAQEIISLYTLWDRYKEDGHDRSARTAFPSNAFRGTKRSASGVRRSGSVVSGGTSTSRSGTPGEESHTPHIVTSTYLTQLLVRMREAKLADMAHPPNGRPMAYDKRLERTQNA